MIQRFDLGGKPVPDLAPRSAVGANDRFDPVGDTAGWLFASDGGHEQAAAWTRLASARRSRATATRREPKHRTCAARATRRRGRSACRAATRGTTDRTKGRQAFLRKFSWTRIPAEGHYARTARPQTVNSRLPSPHDRNSQPEGEGPRSALLPRLPRSQRIRHIPFPAGLGESPLDPLGTAESPVMIP